MGKQPICFITSKDVQDLLEIELRRAQRMLARVRKFFGKETGQPVTVIEFCTYTGLQPTIVYTFLRNRPSGDGG